MKIIQILQGVSNLSAGPTYSVGCISHYLNTIGQCDVHILAAGKRHEKWSYRVDLALFDEYAERVGFLSNKAVKYYLNAIVDENCIIHEHGVWRSMNILPLFGKKNAKLIWSPRGMFSDWSMKHHWFIKSPFWHLLQKPALNKADCFHATSEQEVLDIRRLGFLQPIALIPNGVEMPNSDQFVVSKSNTIIFLSRIHKKKGVHILINAWKKIEHLFPHWNIKIAGVLDSDYASDMQSLVKSLQLPRIEFIGGIFGEEKAQLLASSRLFVLPSYSENFGIAIAEALAHGTPVITTVHTPWHGVIERDCGWFIDADEQSLTEALKHALSLPEPQLDEMGMNGSRWMEVDFSWVAISKNMLSTYNWLNNMEGKPDFVYLK